MRLTSDVGPAGFEHAGKSRDVMEISVNIASEGSGQRRKEAKIPKGGEH